MKQAQVDISLKCVGYLPHSALQRKVITMYEIGHFYM
jgi:hypothetical protein